MIVRTISSRCTYCGAWSGMHSVVSERTKVANKVFLRAVSVIQRQNQGHNPSHRSHDKPADGISTEQLGFLGLVCNDYLQIPNCREAHSDNVAISLPPAPPPTTRITSSANSSGSRK